MTRADVGDDADLIPSITAALGDPAVTEIVVHPGRYVEQVRIGRRAAPLVVRSSTGRADDVVLTFGLCQGDRGRTGMELVQDCATMTVDGDDVTVSGITIENSFDKRAWPDRPNTQALALRTRGTRVLVADCVLLGQQDTVLLDTPSYAQVSHVRLWRCRVEGDVDFVYGRATAVLEECVIHSVGPGWVAAPSTARENPRGLLFWRCELTADDDVAAGSVHLGRPWHPGNKPDAVGQAWFVGCHLGVHVAAQPWTDMGGHAWRDARLAERDSTGPGAADDVARPTVVGEVDPGTWLQCWEPAPPVVGAVHVVGDSAAARPGAERTPREGWAQRLPELLGRAVHDHAVPGAGAQDFADAGLLDEVLAALRPHDLLLVQFGEGEGTPADRDADVFGRYAAQLRRYLVGARARGAVPVLLTPVERRCFDAEGRARSTHGGYPQQVRDLAAAERVPLVDVTLRSRALWQQQGAEGSAASFLRLATGAAELPDGARHESHLSGSGARAVARIVAAGLVEAGLVAADELAPGAEVAGAE